MTEAVVGVGNGREPLRIRLEGKDATFRLRADRISAALVGPIEPRLEDLLDIAAIVFAADSSVKRGSDTRPGMGEAWRRSFDFHIQVRDLAFWSRSEVTSALGDAVTLLTEDIVSFSFCAREAGTPAQEFLAFDPHAAAFAADEVLLFSGGLDSFAGALETLSTSDARVVLVTHRSSQKAAARQKRLGAYLMGRFPGRVLQIQVAAHRVGGEAQEATQRSRSLLFAALGQVVARMFGADRMNFFENGIIGHNLPISPQVVGTMATRTTHPLALSKLNDLMVLIGDGSGAAIQNPYQWLTKTDVVRRIAEHGAAEQIRYAVSCTSIREQDRLHTHCGACSQCFDRRFAMLAAGLVAEDPAEMYGTEVLTGPRDRDRSRTMALDWTRHAVRLADIEDRTFLSLFGQEVMRIARAYPDRPQGEVLRQILDLHRRHGRLVTDALAQVIRDNADRIARQQLPDGSLIRLLAAGDGAVAPTLAPDPRGTAPLRQRRPEDPAEAPDLVLDRGRPLEVTFTVEKGRPVISVRGLGRVEGAPARTAHELKPEFDEDRQAALPRTEHRYVATGTLATRLELSKDAVAQQVGRCRKELAQFHEEVFGSPPGRPLLIENKARHGYRLDPDIRVVSRDGS